MECWINGLLSLLLCALNSVAAPMQSPAEFIDRVRSVVESHVIEKLALAPQDVIVEISYVENQEYTHQPDDELRVLPSEKGVQRGLQYLTCGVFSNGQMQIAFRVRARIKTFQTVVVSAVKVGRHETLAPEQLMFSRRETTGLQPKFFTTIESAAGLRARRILREGEIITEAVVEPAPVVTIGSPVDILFKRGALIIKLPGAARADGWAGQVIKIKCLENNRVYDGEVVDAKTVVVNL